MLGVGLLIPNFRAEMPLFKSFATILTLTRDSLLYAETHLLGITRMVGCFFFNASTSAWPITLPAPHFCKLPISSFIPSKPRSTSNCMSELSSITSSGFQSSTSVPPSLTFTHVWSFPCANLIEFSSASNNSGVVACAFSGPCSKHHSTGPSAWHALSMRNKSNVMGTGVPDCLSASISASKSSMDCSASLFTPVPATSMSETTSLEPSPTGAGSCSVSISSYSTCGLDLAPSSSATGVAKGVWLASKAALFLLHSALCLIPGATIPESHAGHLGVFGKTRTDGPVASGEGEEDVGEAFGDARIGSWRAIFNSPDFLGFDGGSSAERFRASGAL